jgi:hypothetical protein
MYGMPNMNTVRFACTALMGTNKTGKLVKDANGYYTVVLGALDVLNSAGAFYSYEGAKELFEESGPLMRRVANGALKGEYGHPKRLPGMTIDEFAQRIMTINERDICVHIKEVYLDFESIKDPQTGKPVIAIFGKILPSGPMGPALEKSLENPDENVCFSIRSFTHDTQDRRGQVTKVLKTIVTWDYVNEPGIKYANKYGNPALESFDGDETEFTRGNIQRAVDPKGRGFGLESSVILTAEELFQSMNWQFDTSKKPGYANW